MMMNRRDFIASLSLLPAALTSAEGPLPANRNIKWALSAALWNYFPPCPFTSILDDMKATGFIGVRVTGFPHILDQYGLTAAQMEQEVSKRDLNVVTISWSGPLENPAQRQQVLDSARNAMKFLADFGANHLVVFSPNRTNREPTLRPPSKSCASGATRLANWPARWDSRQACTTTWGRWCRRRKRLTGSWR